MTYSVSDISIQILFLKEHDCKIKLERCIKSLLDANVNYKQISICDGILGNIGLARSNALERCNTSLVCHVDCDDTVTPNGITDCLNVFNTVPLLDLVYTHENVFRKNKFIMVNPTPHHLLMFNTKFIQKHLDLFNNSKPYQNEFLPFIEIANRKSTGTIGYNYYPSSYNK